MFKLFFRILKIVKQFKMLDSKTILSKKIDLYAPIDLTVYTG